MTNTIHITRDGNNVTLTAKYSSISKGQAVCNSLDFWKITPTSAFWTGHESHLTNMLPKLTNKFGAAFEIIENSTTKNNKIETFTGLDCSSTNNETRHFEPTTQAIKMLDTTTEEEFEEWNEKELYKQTHDHEPSVQLWDDEEIFW
ncbi:MAG: hypothetical protein ACR2MD_03595 [Aridibacter sp.]